MKIRAYGKTELALLYYPTLSESAARRNFMHELMANRQLWGTLRRQGVKRHSRMFHPRAVRTIVRFLGEA